MSLFYKKMTKTIKVITFGSIKCFWGNHSLYAFNFYVNTYIEIKLQDILKLVFFIPRYVLIYKVYLDLIFFSHFFYWVNKTIAT